MPPEVSVSPKLPIKILIADDHPLIRKIVKSTLKRESHFDVIDEAENGLEAVHKAEKLKPDVAVLNITFCFMSSVGYL